MKYVTEAELAEHLKLPVEKVADLRKRRRWPHLRFGRWDIRYTEAQVAEVERIQTEVSKTRTPAPLLDQTTRSRRTA